MFLVIQTSLSGIELLFGNTHKHIDTLTQSLTLPTAVTEFLAECGASFKDITAIGVIVGPGSFTGIRLGIAYAKGLSIGLGVPVIPINAFELYLESAPDAFVAIDSKRGDFFVASANLTPCTMTIDEIEVEQMKCPRTVGHKPSDLKNAIAIMSRKLSAGNIEPAVPMYLRPSYAEINCKN